MPLIDPTHFNHWIRLQSNTEDRARTRLIELAETAEEHVATVELRNEMFTILMTYPSLDLPCDVIEAIFVHCRFDVVALNTIVDLILTGNMGGRGVGNKVSKVLSVVMERSPTAETRAFLAGIIAENVISANHISTEEFYIIGWSQNERDDSIGTDLSTAAEVAKLFRVFQAIRIEDEDLFTKDAFAYFLESLSETSELKKLALSFHQDLLPGDSEDDYKEVVSLFNRVFRSLPNTFEELTVHGKYEYEIDTRTLRLLSKLTFSPNWSLTLKTFRLQKRSFYLLEDFLFSAGPRPGTLKFDCPGLEYEPRKRLISREILNLSTIEHLEISEVFASMNPLIAEVGNMHHLKTLSLVPSHQLLRVNQLMVNVLRTNSLQDLTFSGREHFNLELTNEEEDPWPVSQADMDKLIAENTSLTRFDVEPRILQSSALCHKVHFCANMNRFGKVTASNPCVKPTDFGEQLARASTLGDPLERFSVLFGLMRQCPPIWCRGAEADRQS